ncbi:MFS transporter [Kribbella deserti]|uniref:MFS transporter n=1 Tax=Kribbella deserti TaxID=1926257 RepID=A0ABV6QHY3_9ACTN
MDLSAYRNLWRTRGVAALLSSALLARLPATASMVPMAYLAKDAAGSFGWAGVVAGAYSVGMAIGGPAWSRWADRCGGKGVLLVTGLAWSVLIAALALLPTDLYRWMPVVALVAGAFVPPVTSTLRAGWPRLVRGRDLRAAYALDATAQELVFVAGPMLGALVVSVASPRTGLLTAAVAAGISIWWFSANQPAPKAHDESTGTRLTARGLLWHRYRLPLIASFGLMVMAFGAVSIGVVAFADEQGNRLIAGGLEAVWALGSLLGGVVAGALPGRRTSAVWRRGLMVSAGMLLCVFATGSAWTLGAALFVSGCFLAPTVGALYERLGTFTPDSVRTEVFGWMGSAGMAGGAIGSSVAGGLVEAFGVPAAWIAATALTAAAALLLIRIPPHRPAEHDAVDPVDAVPVRPVDAVPFS